MIVIFCHLSLLLFRRCLLLKSLSLSRTMFGMSLEVAPHALSQNQAKKQLRTFLHDLLVVDDQVNPAIAPKRQGVNVAIVQFLY